jgi:hypothetical protein
MAAVNIEHPNVAIERARCGMTTDQEINDTEIERRTIESFTNIDETAQSFIESSEMMQRAYELVMTFHKYRRGSSEFDESVMEFVSSANETLNNIRESVVDDIDESLKCAQTDDYGVSNSMFHTAGRF